MYTAHVQGRPTIFTNNTIIVLEKLVGLILHSRSQYRPFIYADQKLDVSATCTIPRTYRFNHSLTVSNFVLIF
jgi:hypothetical protein